MKMAKGTLISFIIGSALIICGTIMSIPNKKEDDSNCRILSTWYLKTPSASYDTYTYNVDTSCCYTLDLESPVKDPCFNIYINNTIYTTTFYISNNNTHYDYYAVILFRSNTETCVISINCYNGYPYALKLSAK